MMYTISADINNIQPNPWQPRQGEDAAHVRKIAESIATQGLMQEPVARLLVLGKPVTVADASLWASFSDGGTIQLAFGHTRLAAYKLLNRIALALKAGQPVDAALSGAEYETLMALADKALEARGETWQLMPLSIMHLSDDEMFRMGVQENLARKDLTPIEEAIAMKRYRDDFGKTSAEIGQLFSMSESAVRNKMRLVELPEQAQAALASGQISEGAARQLLSLAKLQPEKAAAVVSRIIDLSLAPETVTQHIESAIDRKKAMQMSVRWQRDEPKGGTGLWPLTWAVETRVSLNWETFLKACPPEWRKQNNFGGITLKAQFEGVTYWHISRGYDLNKLIASGSHPDVARLVWSLLYPPACTACERHAAINGSHYCGLKVCWELKKRAWMQAELQRLVSSMGVPAYKESEGEFEKAGEYYYLSGGKRVETLDEYTAWLAAKDPYLRLRINYSEYSEHKITDSQVVQLVSIHPDAVARVRNEKEKDQRAKDEYQQRNSSYDLDRKRREQALLYIRERAAWAFITPFKSLPLPMLAAMAFEDPGTDKPWGQLAHIVAQRLISPNFTELSKGPMHIARHLRQLAITWGLPEPLGGWDMWMVQAQEYEDKVTDGEE